MADRLRLIGRAALRGARDLVEGDALTHAASVAYYTLLSLFPFLLLLMSLMGRMTARPAARDAVMNLLVPFFPRQFDFIAAQLDAFRGQALQLGLGGTLALAWAALGVFGAVSTAVNTSWGVERPRSFLHHRVFAFVMMLASGVMLALGVTLVSAVRIVQARWFRDLGIGGALADWLRGATPGYLITGLFVLAVALVLRFVPNTRVRFADVWPGAIMTAVLWRVAGKILLWYAGDVRRWSIHGSIASVVVFLLFVYVLAVILLYGVELTAEYARLRRPVAPTPAQGHV